MVEPSFCGSYTESEPTCMMHHQRPKKMVAFEGALTGRRFLGCPVQQVLNLVLLVEMCGAACGAEMCDVQRCVL